MTTIAILPENPQSLPTRYRAVSGIAQSYGATAGQALDALQAQIGEQAQTTLVVVQSMRPDALFNAVQQRRLAELLDRWRAARDTCSALTPQEQNELDALVEAELRAATERSATLVRQLPS